jgi:trimeric autotransporter adhesin
MNIMRTRITKFETGAANLLLALATALMTTADKIKITDDNWVSVGSVPVTGGFGIWVHSMATDEAGNLYVAGGWTAVGDTVVNEIGKWDGSNWSPLGSGLNGTPVGLTTLGSDLFVTGEFTRAGGIEVNGIAKWDGHAWSSLESPVSVSHLKVFGGQLYAKGSISTGEGVVARHIVKWTGDVWIPLGAAVDAMTDFAVMGDELFVTGSFGAGFGVYQHGIAQGEDGEWVLIGDLNISDDYPNALLTTLGSDLYVASFFTMVNDAEISYMARWDGSKWSSLGSGLDGPIIDMATSATSLAVKGVFDKAGGTQAHGIARWDGSTWSAPTSGVSGGGGSGPTKGEGPLIAVSATHLYVGGSFTMAGGVEARALAQWNGTEWSSLNPVSNPVNRISQVAALIVSGQNAYVGGYFFTESGPGYDVAKWSGRQFTMLESRMDGSVVALAISGNDLYAGGGFTMVDGNPANHIAKWDGDHWSSLGSGVDGDVRALAILDDTLIAAGAFATAGGKPASQIAKWDGSAWSPLGRGIQGGMVTTLAAYGGDLYAGGWFTSADGKAASHVARWDGEAWFPLGTGLTGSDVEALAASSDGLYVGGYFMSAGNVEVNFLAKWDGTAWSALGSALNESPQALAVVDGSLFAAGGFKMADGIEWQGIARWDGSGWSGLGSEVGGVSVLAGSGRMLYAGGGFTKAGGKASYHLARVFLDGVPPLEVVNGHATVYFRGTPAGAYRIERTTDLKTWEHLLTRYAGETGGIDYVDENAPDSAAYYRAVPIEP